MRSIGGQIGHDHGLIRCLVQQQGFEQRIVKIGQRFEQMRALSLLSFKHFAGHVDALTVLAGSVTISAFKREIDVAGDLLGTLLGQCADWDLAQRERLAAQRL